ncbi:MAG: hypothetical protein K2V38_19500 [Gemmataceae bacterium]|nr:hypothetical protein [Gemmataceae bacterium]
MAIRVVPEGALDLFNVLRRFASTGPCSHRRSPHDDRRTARNRQASRIERNENIASKFLTDEELRAVAIQMMMAEVYKRL